MTNGWGCTTSGWIVAGFLLIILGVVFDFAGLVALGGVFLGFVLGSLRGQYGLD